MAGERTIFIAHSKKTMLHYFLRVMPLDEVRACNVGPDEANALLTAKTQKQLGLAIRDLGILFDTKAFDVHTRIQTVENFSSTFEAVFGSVKPKRLAHEMFLASSFGLRANLSENSPAACFDALDNDILRYLDGLKGEDCEYAVVVEPVQDWMTARNLLAIAASALALVTSGSDPRALENLGFTLFGKSKVGQPVYAIPFKFNAYYWFMDIGNHPIKSLSTDAADIDYLFWLLEKDYERKVGNNRLVFPISPDESVGIATGPIATGSSYKIIGHTQEEDRNLYLYVLNEGTQEEMANRVIASIWYAFENLHDTDGARFGMQKEEAEYFWQSPKNDKLTCGSTASALFYEVFNHEGKRLISCKRCRNALLAPTRGPIREFCSDSCRVLASREGN